MATTENPWSGRPHSRALESEGVRRFCFKNLERGTPADASLGSRSNRVLVRLTSQRRRWRLNLPPSLDLFCLPRWSLFLLPPPRPPNLAGREGSRKRVRAVPSGANLPSCSMVVPVMFLMLLKISWSSRLTSEIDVPFFPARAVRPTR